MGAQKLSNYFKWKFIKKLWERFSARPVNGHGYLWLKEKLNDKS